MIIYKTKIANEDWGKLVDLYDETGMCLGLGTNRETEKIKRAYTNSFRFVTAWNSNIIVGAGRMICDGECYGWIHDVAILSSYRKKGIGRAVIQKLLDGNENILIGLTSSFEAVDFYTKIGFNKHKTAMAKYPGHSDYLHY